jgi:hypothetical protein
VESLAGVHEHHPGKGVLLVGVDAPLFWNAIRDHSYQLVGVDHLYLPPGSEKLAAGGDASWEGVEDFTIAGLTLEHALGREELEVYDVRGPRLHNITTLYASLPIDMAQPRRLTGGDPALAEMFGPEWYPIEVDHRWMPHRATLKIGGPTRPGEHLYLHGYVSAEQLHAGPVDVTATVDGVSLPAGRVTGTEFELNLPLPDSIVGKPVVPVTLEVNRTIRPPGDGRELGMAFGEISVK